MTENRVFIKECEKMASYLFDVMEIKFEESTEFDRQILSVFSFGMINAYAIEEKIDLNLVPVSMEFILIKVFKYSKEQAGSFLELLIAGTKKENDPTFYRIIHDGIDMYYEYQKDETDKMFDRIMDTYLRFRKK
ncbi:Imm48 family immunity protein [Peptostreptococcaceae bacterium AGR-M142]